MQMEVDFIKLTQQSVDLERTKNIAIVEEERTKFNSVSLHFLFITILVAGRDKDQLNGDMREEEERIY